MAGIAASVSVLPGCNASGGRSGHSGTVNDHGQAAVYSHGNAFYITGEDQTVDGILVMGSVRTVDATDSDHALGAAVLAALGGSRHDVPTPGRDAQVTGALLEASGTKTWGTFARHAELVRVERDGIQIRLERWPRMAGRPHAFEPELEGNRESTSTPDPVELGQVIRQALT